MTLIQRDQAKTHIKQDQNLFILDLVSSNKIIQAIQLPRAIIMQDQKRLTYLINKNI